ncbi:MAG: TIR domain-containing protein, partial [Candidatus Poribacteria bacterium]|nr:TIR domain-containing protein [Candidatus Poribacteria bacterium]
MHKYDVALSFAGEDRKYAEELAKLLESGGYLFFYDKYERAQLWGTDLYQRLSRVYKDQARYCVMFLSRNYARTLWSRHELMNAQARAFAENQEYILPVLLDDTEIPGIPPTVAYLDLRELTIEEVYQDFVKKLSGSQSRKSSNEEITPNPLVSESK